MIEDLKSGAIALLGEATFWKVYDLCVKYMDLPVQSDSTFNLVQVQQVLLHTADYCSRNSSSSNSSSITTNSSFSHYQLANYIIYTILLDALRCRNWRASCWRAAAVWRWPAMWSLK